MKKILFLFIFLSLLLPAHLHATDVDLGPVPGEFFFIQNRNASQFLSGFTGLAFMGAGIVAFFYFLVGGFQWITAGGDKEAVEKARRRIIQAIIGLVIVFSVFVFTFIVYTLFRVNVTNINIPTV